jgi:hypothetical protein
MRALVVAFLCAAQLACVGRVHAEAARHLRDGVPADAPGVSAPLPEEPAPSIDAETERLEAWLVLHAQRAYESRLLWGVIACVLGGTEIPIESVILAMQPSHPSDATTNVFGAVGIVFGVLDLAYGIYRLASPSVAERRLERFRTLRAIGVLDERHLGRFEGEIRGELAGIEESRWMWTAIGIGLVAAGGVGAALTAALADSELSLWVGYVSAATSLVSGVLLAILPWLDAGLDDEWRRIDGGEAPHASLTPWASPSGGGLLVHGTF